MTTIVLADDDDDLRAVYSTCLRKEQTPPAIEYLPELRGEFSLRQLELDGGNLEGGSQGTNPGTIIKNPFTVGWQYARASACR